MYIKRSLLVIVFFLFAAVCPVSGGTVKKVSYSPAGTLSQPGSLPFKPGEKLTYTISWSNIIDAGTSVMEVREATGPDGKKSYHLISTARSTGMVSRFYKVSDRVESFIDPEKLCSLSFHLDQNHGNRKRTRDMTFDHANSTVQVLSGGKQASYPVPGGVQDSLSSLYYVRTRQDFTVGKPILIDVHEDGKTWSVEVQTLGREKINTALGELNTIKLKTYPRYEGVFQHTGEIYIWLTDDARKIPVLMKSEISIGTINATLVDVRTGEKN